jgi:excisionase family DNA binding protein
MSEPVKNPFDALLDAFRQIVREEIQAQFAARDKCQGLNEKEWLKADEAAKLYGLPKTWFEEKGRAGDIARTKPGRYVLFKRRDVEEYLEKNKSRQSSLT